MNKNNDKHWSKNNNFMTTLKRKIY